MKEGRPSQTAAMVAVWRALADDGHTSARGFSDPVARELLSPGWSRVYQMSRRWLEKSTPERRARAMAAYDVMPLRVLAIDAELERALAAGCRQLVVLGAGLDTRAFRVAALAGCDVFEVDHPDTQAYKRRKAEPLPRRSRSLTYVAVDFERDDLVARLAASGHRADEPTVWIWEGVVMYLSLEGLRGSLAAIARASAPGSRVLLHYHTPADATQSGAVRGFRRALFAVLGEPMIGLRSPVAMHEEVTRARLVVESDTSATEWAGRFGAAPLAGSTARVARLLVARRL